MNNKQQTFNNLSEINRQYTSYPASFFYMNIRSLRLNFASFLVNINQIIHKIKFIILVEKNISDNEITLYNIHGFNAVFFNREGRGGGIVVYIRENIKYSHISVTTNSFELIQVDIKVKTETLSLFAIYRPPNHSPIEFIKELEELLSKINKKKEIMIIGDINIDIHKQSNTTTYLDMLLSYGMQCMINEKLVKM